MEPRIRLVTRGDDAGSCDSANRAIVESFQKGILRNTSVMACGPALPAAAELLSGLKGICIGVHVTLNSEWDAVKWGPVLPKEKVPSLVDERGFLTRTPRVLHERNANVEEMVAEAQAQLDLLRKHRLDVKYLDDHMGVGWVGGLTERLARLAEKEGLLAAETIQFSRLPKIENPPADRFGQFAARLRAAEPGNYLFVTHPGMDAPDMRAMGHGDHTGEKVVLERDGDRRLLTDPRLPELLREIGCEVVRYTDLSA